MAKEFHRSASTDIYPSIGVKVSRVHTSQSIDTSPCLRNNLPQLWHQTQVTGSVSVEYKGSIMPDMRVYDTIRRFPVQSLYPVDMLVPSLLFLLLPGRSTFFRICLVAASRLGVGVAGVVLPLVG